MLTTATQQMNEGETRALYAKLGSLSDPTWRMVGSVTRTAVGVRAGYSCPRRRPSARCGRHVSAGTALLSRISCAWSSAWRVTVVASTRSPVAFVTPEARREVRRNGRREPVFCVGYVLPRGGPLRSRTPAHHYPSWMVNSGDAEFA